MAIRKKSSFHALDSLSFGKQVAKRSVLKILNWVFVVIRH